MEPTQQGNPERVAEPCRHTGVELGFTKIWVEGSKRLWRLMQEPLITQVCHRPPKGRGSQALSLAFTASLTVFPSAFLPASFAIAAFITPPMSFIDDAPVSATAAATACSISSCEAACGR